MFLIRSLLVLFFIRILIRAIELYVARIFELYAVRDFEQDVYI